MTLRVALYATRPTFSVRHRATISPGSARLMPTARAGSSREATPTVPCPGPRPRRHRINVGDREINQDEAEIVRRIFREFASGKSPRQIAHGLNRDGIPAPGDEGCGQSTINGNAARGTGILSLPYATVTT
jgi:hypothetical protein